MPVTHFRSLLRILQQHPVTWQGSADGTKWIGHMILKKTVLEGTGHDDSGAILGLKIVGGRKTDQGQFGAFITKVKKGSIADTYGHLRPVKLYSFYSTGEVPPQEHHHHHHHHQNHHIKDSRRADRDSAGHFNRPSVTVTSPESSSSLRSRTHSPQAQGKVQVKLLYNRKFEEMIVTIIAATDLPLTDQGKLRQPYCKVYLLPDRSNKSKRRTKTVPNTVNPTWNQMFMYPIKESEFTSRLMEITLWDYDRRTTSEFLGEVLIDLSKANLTDEAFWYQLQNHDENGIPLPQPSPRRLNQSDPYYFGKEHLSPPLNSRGHSDSDISEFEDFAGIEPGRRSISDDSWLSSSPCSDDIPLRRGGVRSPKPLAPRVTSQETHKPLFLPHKIDPLEKLRQAIVTSSREDQERRQKHSNFPAENLNVTSDQGQSSSRQRSRSPIPSEVASSRRSRSPATYHCVPDQVSRSLSPPEIRSSQMGHLVGLSPSSTPSPKKRQLPAIPTDAQRASRDRVTRDLEQRALQMKLRMGIPSNATPTLSDSECYHDRRRHSNRRERSYERGYHDRDMSYGGRDIHGGDRTPGRYRRREYNGDRDERDQDIGSDAESDMSEISKVSTLSVRSTQSERPTRKFSEFTKGMEKKTTMPRRQLPRNSSNDSQGEEKNDGSVSDSALSASVTEGRRRRPSLTHKVASLVGLPWRSNSASQIAEGNKKRSSFVRSEEVGAHGTEVKLPVGRGMIKQASKDSTDGSIGSISSDSGSVVWLPTGMRLGPEGQFGEFIEGLGPAQLVGRQVLGSPCMGEIQLGLYDRKGHLEVEVIRARGLLPKSGAKILPAPYVKVYLIDGKTCVEKQKTTVARRTLDPLYQQQLVFTEHYVGKILQVTVWGDYGRMDRKVFMGVAQILLDHLDLTNIVIGWYKLFTSSSLVGHHGSSSTIGHSRKGSTTSLDSGFNNNSPRT
ncbi:hypothetical protein FSP39_024004 [Pinctada imbricata]|uniref:C2 domain-containing protein n=1 Tax=Pinctada imbricata TaxID=66713 RepID=A0AA88XR12_PINIB|nr:hypothetical protein FSP39_024004 [Pinctada imbricata]